MEEGTKEMTHSESIKELATALSLAQHEIKAAEQNATNPFLKNKYADLGSVTEAVREPLAKNGLAYSQLPYTENGELGIETILMHQSGEWITSRLSLPMGDEKGKSQAQVAGSVITYLRRYALSAMLGVYAGDDDDGSTKTEKKTTQAQAKPQPVPPPPSMTLEEAMAVTDSKGKKYGDLTTDTLSYMFNEMDQGIKGNKYTDRLQEFVTKREACKLILDARAESDAAMEQAGF